MKLIPLNDEILLREKQQDDITKGGIYIPRTAQEETTAMGEVLAVSEGILLENGTLRPHSVSPGDVVIFDRRSATEVKIEGERLVLIRSLTLLAKVAA